MPPLISVVTPSYNQGEFIEDNIKSILEQDYPNIEHIVVDGGSEDDTIEILQSYQNKYNLRWVSEPDRGQSHAINKGIEMANGNWIGWQNSDDYYLENAFKIFRRSIRNNPNVDLLYGDVAIVDDSGNEINRKFNTCPSSFIQRHWSVFANNQSTLFHENIFEKIGLISENLKYTMDAEFMWRILKSDIETIHIPEVLGAFRKHKEAKTIDSDVGVHPELEKVYEYGDIERKIPKGVSTKIAKTLKLYCLIRNKQWYAIEYNIKQKL